MLMSSTHNAFGDRLHSVFEYEDECEDEDDIVIVHT